MSNNRFVIQLTKKMVLNSPASVKLFSSARKDYATLGRRGSKLFLTDSYVNVYRADIGAELTILLEMPRYNPDTPK